MNSSPLLLLLTILAAAACGSTDRSDRTTTRFRDPDVGPPSDPAACAELSACCPSLEGSDPSACDAVAGAANGEACVALLSTYRGSGRCSGIDAGPDDLGPDDAGPPDLGPREVGPSDAGAPDDLGPQDTGGLDLGPQDTGVLDLGPQDTGVLDLGPEDAGPEDAGAVDLGRPDAGAPRDAGRPPDLGLPLDGGLPDLGLGMACVELQRCCPNLPAQDRMTCDGTAATGQDILCFILLQSYVAAGQCPP